MSLQSQSPRSAVTRRYTTNTRRRRKGLAPWLVLIGVVVILAGLYVIFGGPGEPKPTAASEDDASEAANESGESGSDENSSPDNQAQAAGRGPTNPRPIAPVPTGSSDRDRVASPAYADQADRLPLTRASADDDPPKLAGEAKDQFELGIERLEAGDIVAGRALLSELLFREGALPRHEAHAVRQRLANLSERMVFSTENRSSEQVAKDPILAMHKVQPGEYLSTVANNYRIPYQLIERINDIQANRLQAGQPLQVIKGPVHAQVDKSEYRMDLYVLDPDGIRIYLKSYTVGLGEFDSTPVGTWRVKPGSKVGPANGGPSWRNPRTGKVYDRNDPDIPIGEYWMALEGLDENTKGKAGYGIHATNNPESIGRQESMGCIRMRDEDVDEVFYTLFEGASKVEILP